MSLRIVFMGTPDYGVPSLNALLDAGHDVCAVFCQPDRPSGRGQKVTFCPVKQAALEKGIPVFQPAKTRVDGVEPLRNLAPDLCVTAAFGHILSEEVLSIPRFGTVNVHASLLPRYRGSAPVNWAIACGEKVTGVTTMMTDKGLDTGDILLQREVEIGPKETAGELIDRLAAVGAQLLVETVRLLEEGTCPRRPQEESEASYYPMLKKETGVLDLARPAEAVACLARGMTPWPGASLGGLRVLSCTAEPWEGVEEAGCVLQADPRNGLLVRCGEGALRIGIMKAPGGRAMDAREYLRGHVITVGSRITANA